MNLRLFLIPSLYVLPLLPANIQEREQKYISQSISTTIPLIHSPRLFNLPNPRRTIPLSIQSSSPATCQEIKNDKERSESQEIKF